MSVQEQAIQMIRNLSDDNVKYLIDFMKRFMLPKDEYKTNVSEIKHGAAMDFMQEMESMRMRAKPYFPSEFDSEQIWEEAMAERYDRAD